MKSTAKPGTIEIEVAYAAPGDQILRGLTLPEGATVSTALEACVKGGLLPEDVLKNPDVGVFGQVVGKNHVLRTGDRVEFYRALIADPRDTRRRRASSGLRRRERSVDGN